MTTVFLLALMACNSTTTDPGVSANPPGTEPPVVDEPVVEPAEVTSHSVVFDATTERVRFDAGVNDNFLDLHFAAFGRNAPSALDPVDPVAETTDAGLERVVFEHDGLSEWYEVRDEGVKQGFDVASSPAGEGELQFVFDVESSLLPVFKDAGDGGALLLVDDRGHTQMTYDGLVTFDATGAEIPSWMEYACDVTCELRLVVDDAGAEYPLHVDPLVAVTLQTVSSSSTQDDFGIAVDIEGDVAAVGAPLEDAPGTNAGVVRVYRRSGTTWALEQTITSTTGNNDRCGRSVAVAQDRLAVGCYTDNASGTESGGARVYSHSGGVWTLEADLQSAGVPTFQRMGFSMDIDPAGERLIMGGWGDQYSNVANRRTGRATIFERVGTVWTEVAALEDTTAQQSVLDGFGYSVAITSDRAVVGARLRDVAGTSNTDSGSAFLYSRTAGVWTLDQVVEPTNGTRRRVGHAVTIHDSTMAVSQDNFGWGRVYIYTEGAPGSWSLQQTFVADDRSLGDNFGWDLALEGDRLAIGSRQDESGGVSDRGSVYMYERDGTTWSEELEYVLTGADSIDGQRFGSSVGMSGDWLVAGTDPSGNGVESAHFVEFAACGPFVTQADCDVALQVTEFHPSPNNALTGQFIEIRNNGTTDGNLSGLRIETGAGIFEVSSSLPIKAGGYVVVGQSDVEADNGGITSVFPIPTLSLDASADTITLIDPDDVNHDSVSYSGFTSTGASIGLSFDGLDYADASVTYGGPLAAGNWCEAWSPHVGDDTGFDFMTPGADNDNCARTFNFDFSYTDSGGGTLASGSTTMMLDNASAFSTGNAGTGTYARTTDATGQLLELTYDDTAVTYTSFVRLYGSTCFTGGTMGNLPAVAASGDWDNTDCP